MGIITNTEPEKTESAMAKALVEARGATNLYKNYMGIVNNPNAPITQAQDDNDHGSNNGYSILQLEKDAQVPAHPDPAHPVALPPSLPPRDLQTLTSDTFANTVLASLCSEGTDPKDEVKKFGKNATYIADKDGKITYLAILDPNTHEVSAYKTLVVEQDMHTNKNATLDPNGFAGAGFVKLKLDESERIPGKYNSVNEFMNEHQGWLDTLAKEPKVMVEYSGFQINMENWATPGRLDRGDLSKQLSRVLDFNKALAIKMQEEGLPATTEVCQSAHSLGTLSAPIARFYWENNLELKQYGKAGPVTLFEPVAETGALRQVAFLIAAEKNTAAAQTGAPKTDLETEIRNLTKDTDIVMNGNSSKILHGFQPYESADNGKIAGSRYFEIPFDNSTKTSFSSADVAMGAVSPLSEFVKIAKIPLKEVQKMDDHFIVNMGRQMLKGQGLRQMESPDMMTPAQIAELPKNDHAKDFLDTRIRDSAYLIASMTAATEKDGFKWGKENDFLKTATDIGQSLGLPQTVVGATVSAAHVPNRVIGNTMLAKK